ncbi:MAG: phosphotransferase [Acidimicrobiales bacterium]|nr:phosphotransferase [Acidimicrobiales bacterium]
MTRPRLVTQPGGSTSSGLGRVRAMGALAAVGLPGEDLTRVDSVTNEVWVTPDYVVRVNRDPSLRLHREAVLSQILPEEVGYPPLVQHGGEIGNDWLVLRRLPGITLSRAWPDLDRDQRRHAVRQVAQRLRAVHSTPCPQLEGLRDVPQLLDQAPTGAQAAARLLEQLQLAKELPHIDVDLIRDAEALVSDTASSLDPFNQTTVVHGDLTFENILWDGADVTAILDFEFARPGPPDLDLDVLLRFCSLPYLHVPLSIESRTKAIDYAEVPWWFVEDYPELFAHPRQFERVRLYSMAWDVRELMQFPPQEPLSRLHKHHPYQRLAQSVRGTHYLDQLNGTASLHY